METREFAQGPLPSRQEAQDALEAVKQARSAVETAQWPAWYFAALGAWVAPIGLLSRMPTEFPQVLLGVVALVVWMVLLGVIVGLGATRVGVVPSPSRKQLVHMAAILAPVVVAALLIAQTVGKEWLWPSLSLLEGGMIIAYSLLMRRWNTRSA